MGLNIAQVNTFSKDIEDDYFEKAQKLTSIEVNHAFTLAIKEKELEIALAMVKRKISKV